MKKMILISEDIYDLLIGAAQDQIEDINSGVGDGIYDDSEENKVLVNRLQEAIDSRVTLTGGIVYNLADMALPEKFPLATFDSFEVHPCIEEDGGTSQIDSTDEQTPHFWSVYVRYKPNADSDFGGLDCVADCATQEEAETFKALLENLVTKYSPA